MSESKLVGWLSLGLFATGVLVLAFVVVLLIFFPNAAFVASLNAQVLFIISGILGLLSAVLGFVSRRTPQGKIGGIGGLVLTIAIGVLLSFTLVTSVSTQTDAVPVH